MIRLPGDSWDGRPRPRCTLWFGDGYPSTIAGACDTIESTVSAADGCSPNRLENLRQGGKARTPLEAASSGPAVRAVPRCPHARPVAGRPPCRTVNPRVMLQSGADHAPTCWGQGVRCRGPGECPFRGTLESAPKVESAVLRG